MRSRPGLLDRQHHRDDLFLRCPPGTREAAIIPTPRTFHRPTPRTRHHEAALHRRHPEREQAQRGARRREGAERVLALYPWQLWRVHDGLRQDGRRAHAAGPATGCRRAGLHVPRLRARRGRLRHHHLGPPVPGPGRAPAAVQGHGRVPVVAPAAVVERRRHHARAPGVPAKVPGPPPGRQHHEDPEGTRRDQDRAAQDNRERAAAGREDRRPGGQERRPQFTEQDVLPASKEAKLVLPDNVGSKDWGSW